jgi:hypothetical protein
MVSSSAVIRGKNGNSDVEDPLFDTIFGVEKRL